MDLNRSLESFLLASSGLLLGFLSSLLLSFLLGVFVLSNGLLLSSSLLGLQFLSFFDFSDGFLSKSLFVLRASVLHLLDVVKGDTLNGSLLSESFLLFVLALIGLF